METENVGTAISRPRGKMNYTFDNKISYADYKALRAAVSFREVSERQFDLGFKNVHYLAVIKDNSKAIGMVKALGDAAYYWVLSDLIVHPDYQGQGLGRTLIEGFMRFVDDSVESGEKVVIHLASSKGKESFYEKFGFKTRPFDNYGAGMSVFYEKT